MPHARLRPPTLDEIQRRLAASHRQLLTWLGEDIAGLLAEPSPPQQLLDEPLLAPPIRGRLHLHDVAAARAQVVLDHAAQRLEE
eukprot:628363-Pyramimonas_sp.AAC.1